MWFMLLPHLGSELYQHGRHENVRGVCSSVLLPPCRDTVLIVWSSAHVKLLHAGPVLQASSWRLNLKTRISSVYVPKSFRFFPFPCLLMLPLSSSTMLSVKISARAGPILWSGITCACKLHKILFPGCDRISRIVSKSFRRRCVELSRHGPC
jgi:hypothetical protein